MGSFIAGNEPEYDKASVSDVRFVLIRGGLGSERIESVVHSYKSPRRFSGNHIDKYAIKVSRLTVEELEDTADDSRKWTRGDIVDGYLKDAVDYISDYAHWGGSSWFPDKELLLSDQTYISASYIELRGERVDEAELIFVMPSENMVYYASVAQGG